MSINRREFVVFSAAAVAAGCASEKAVEKPSGNNAVTLPTVSVNGTVDAGPATDYANDGVYSRFRDNGFFLIRRGPRLFARSSYCTHRKCKLSADPDRSFYCKCHGSTFDPDGKVTDGPATKDLPGFAVSEDARGHVMVKAS